MIIDMKKQSITGYECCIGIHVWFAQLITIWDEADQNEH